MTQDISNPKDLSKCLDQKDTILCGVGFGQSDWSRDVLGITLKFCEGHDGILIIDGGALRILDKNYLLKRNMPSKTILTPILVRLLHCSTLVVKKFKKIELALQ